MKKNKKGFTLVELLAVIVVLAIILVIAVPKILDVIKSSRENSLISSVKLVARNAEQKRLANEVLGEGEEFDCSDVADLSENDYESCTINFDTKGNATVSITGKGKFSGYTCSGTKNNVTCGDAEPLACARGYEYDNYRIRENLTEEQKDACVEFIKSIYGDIWWAEEGAVALCKHEIIDSSKDEYDNDFDNLLDGWGYSTYEEFVNDRLNIYINDYNYHSYDDVSEYFDADMIGCMPNYLVDDWVWKIYDAGIYYLNEVQSVNFYSDGRTYDVDPVDVSEYENGNILAYGLLDEGTGKYDINIVSDEKIYFPPDSSCLFAIVESVVDIESINFNNSVNTSRVFNMNLMFDECRNLVSLDLSGWDTSKVENMSYMFLYCESLEELNISGWDTSNVTEIQGMFDGCESLITLDLSNFDTSNVEYMYDMFRNCSSLEEIDLSNFDTRNVYDMGSMFDNCKNLEHIYVGNKWNTTNVIEDSYMFYNSTNLPNFDDDYIDKTKAYVGEGGYLECKSGHTCTCTYSGC